MGQQRTMGRTNEIRREGAALLRAAASLEAREASAGWKTFRGMVAEGEEEVEHRRLLPLVCRNLTRLGQTRDPYLIRAYAESLAFNGRALGALDRAVETLDSASVPSLALKGCALLLGHYRDPGIRPMSDIDLLVPDGRIGAALDALQANGWRGDPERRWLASTLHAGMLVDGSGMTVDLHRYATYEARSAEANEGFFEGAEAAEFEGRKVRVMGPSDQLLHSIVHGLRWSIAPSDIWMVDAATIIRGGRVEPARLRARARELRLSAAVRQGLKLTREILGPDPRLDALLSALPAARPPELIEHWFRVRSPAGLLGALPNLWFAYQRSDFEGAPLRSFPSFLANTWGAAPEALPSLMWGKARRRLARTLHRD